MDAVQGSLSGHGNNAVRQGLVPAGGREVLIRAILTGAAVGARRNAVAKTARGANGETDSTGDVECEVHSARWRQR